jgi:Tfp pilus assembly protein FimT
MQKKLFVYIRNLGRKTLIHLTTINSTRLINKAGFSLFEFIIVLVVLVALVSIFIPKLSELQKNAHKVSVQQSASSLRSAVNIIHNVWQSQGSKNEAVMIESYGGGKVLVGRSGWPIDVVAINDVAINGQTQKIARLTTNNLTCRRLWNGLLKDSAPKAEDKLDKNTIYLAEFSQGKCRFRYLLNEDEFRIEYDLATGQVKLF